VIELGADEFLFIDLLCVLLDERSRLCFSCSNVAAHSGMESAPAHENEICAQVFEEKVCTTVQSMAAQGLLSRLFSCGVL